MLDEIVLVPKPEFVWRDPVLMKTLAEPLIALEFQDLGAFAVTPFKKIAVRLLVDESAGILAAIFEHPSTGHWLELSSHFVDGGSICYGTSPTPPCPRPDHLRVNVNGLTPYALLNQFKQDRPAQSVLPTNADTAVSVFIDAYADEERWRKERGLLPVAFARSTFAPYRKREPSFLSTVMNAVPGLNRRKRHIGVPPEAALDRAANVAPDAGVEAAAAKRNSARATTNGVAAAKAKPPKRTHWEVLGVSPNATKAELRASYLARCKEYHPDRVASLGERVRAVADEEIRAITAAYEALTRTAQR